jgi:hypothetical protein
MRREELINSGENVLKALKETSIYESIRSVLATSSSSNTKFDPTGIVESLQRFSIISSSFSPAENKILEIFEIKNINSPKIWANILTSTEKSGVRDAVIHIYRAIDALQNYLPKILDLLKKDYEKQIKSKGKAIAVENIIRVILPEEELVSSPERLSNVLESINNFYEVYSIIYNVSKNELGVISLDSGSDKSFDFIGAAKVMESVRKLIIELWDRVVFYRERKVSERLDLIAKSLPIIDKIGQMEQEGKLGPEQCEILRRLVSNGASKFISAGAMLPEFTQYATQNPRQLMTPEPKLLSSSKEEIKKDDVKQREEDQLTEAEEIDTENVEQDNLTDEEKEELEKFYKKIKSRKKS